MNFNLIKIVKLSEQIDHDDDIFANDSDDDL